MKNITKSALFIIAIMTCQAYAQTAQKSDKDNIAFVKAVVGLIQDGTFMNLKTVAHAVDEPDLYHDVIFDDDLMNMYRPKDKNSPFEYIRHQVMPTAVQTDFSQLTGVAEFAFKPSHCPKVTDIEQVTGVQAQTVQQPTSPDLWTGQGGSYTVHYFYLPNEKTFSLMGCRINAYADGKLS